MSDLETLAAKLAAAEGPDRGLADEVMLACGHKGVIPGPTPYATLHWGFADGTHCPVLKRPNPLESLSDARSLIDPTWEWQAIKTGALKYTSGKQFKFECREPSEYGWTQGTPVFRGDHDLEPFSICLAAIKARIAHAG
jgi:hypothetical protein